MPPSLTEFPELNPGLAPECVTVNLTAAYGYSVQAFKPVKCSPWPCLPGGWFAYTRLNLLVRGGRLRPDAVAGSVALFHEGAVCRVEQTLEHLSSSLRKASAREAHSGGGSR